MVVMIMIIMISILNELIKQKGTIQTACNSMHTYVSLEGI